MPVQMVTLAHPLGHILSERLCYKIRLHPLMREMSAICRMQKIFFIEFFDSEFVRAIMPEILSLNESNETGWMRQIKSLTCSLTGRMATTGLLTGSLL